MSEIIDGQRRYQVAIKVPARYRSDPTALESLVLRPPGGAQVSLGQIADVRVLRAAQVINREEGERRIVVMSNVSDRDLGSFVAEVRSSIDREIKPPPGYAISYGGQFENQQRATKRLMLIIPIVLVAIFVLLYLTFRSLKLTTLVIGNIPFALVGGVAALWLRGMNLNLSASIGFIALFGVAILNGVVLVSSINQLCSAGETVEDAVMDGARRRLRPVLMTAFVASFKFIPMAFSSSIGAEVQRPLATVVIGGLVSSTRLTLFLLPMLYEWIFEKRIQELLM